VPAGFCSCDVGDGDGLAEGNPATRLPRFEGKGGVTRFCCCDGEGCCSCGAIRLRGAVGAVAGRAGGAIVVVVDAGFEGETVVMGRMGSELPSGLGGVVIVGVVLKGE